MDTDNLYSDIKLVLDSDRRQANNIYFILVLFYDWLSHKKNWYNINDYCSSSHDQILIGLRKEIKIAKDIKNEQR